MIYFLMRRLSKAAEKACLKSEKKADLESEEYFKRMLFTQIRTRLMHQTQLISC